MNKQKNQSGNIHLFLMIIAVLLIVGFLGFTFWINFLQPKSDSSISNVNSTNSSKNITKSTATEPSKDSPAAVSAQQSKATSDQNGNIKEAFSTNYYHPDLTAISYLFPANWVNGGALPTGFGMKSPDLIRDDNYSISQGSSITVTAEATKLVGTKDDLSSSADLSSKYLDNNIPITTETFVEVDGVNAIVFNYSVVETKNNFTGLLFIKNGHLYEFTQGYSSNSANPYPNLINTIISSLKFAN